MRLVSLAEERADLAPEQAWTREFRDTAENVLLRQTEGEYDRTPAAKSKLVRNPAMPYPIRRIERRTIGCSLVWTMNFRASCWLPSKLIRPAAIFGQLRADAGGGTPGGRAGAIRGSGSVSGIRRGAYALVSRCRQLETRRAIVARGRSGRRVAVSTRGRKRCARRRGKGLLWTPPTVMPMKGRIARPAPFSNGTREAASRP